MKVMEFFIDAYVLKEMLMYVNRALSAEREVEE